MPPFGRRLTAPAVCVRLCMFVCVCVFEHPSPRQSIPSPLCLRLHCMSLTESDKNKQSSVISAYTHTSHPLVTYTHTISTHAPFQMCIWHMKTRHTHVFLNIKRDTQTLPPTDKHIQTNAPSQYLALSLFAVNLFA